MPFNSFRFLLLFLPLVVASYYFLARHASPKAVHIFIIVASLTFYACSQPACVPLLLISALGNFLAARMISRWDGPKRKRLLVVAIAANIVLLACFKYLNLALRNVPYWSQTGFYLPDWVFPLGISFYTLQQIMYLVDCYEGLVPANLLIPHLAFVTFFPTISSGPLTRARQMVPQLRRAAAVTAPMLTRAITLFSIGLFKKVVFADSLALIADAGFVHPHQNSFFEAWVCSFAYTFQIYFDFSGYSDMAIASAMSLGLVIPKNFAAPYRSSSIIEFWQRWHITLSQFITTYLYTPIIRSFRRATLGTAAVATLAAMTIAGLWHGPSLTFVAFGFLHGVALVVNQIWRKVVGIRMPSALGWGCTLLFVNISFIFFRSHSLREAAQFCRSLVSFHGAFSTAGLRESIRFSEAQVIALPVIVGTVAALVGKDSNEIAVRPNTSLGMGIAVATLLLVSMLFMNSTITKEFVYFGF